MTQKRATWNASRICALAASIALAWASVLFWDVSATHAGRPHPAVVKVTAVEKGGISQGTGTLVAVSDQYGLVVTNWHVVRDADSKVVVTFPNGQKSAARIAKVDRDWDLAALLIWRPDVEPMPLASTAPRPGQMLTIAGYGQGNYRETSGHCTQYVAPGANHPYEMVELAARAREGDSGGPILNERRELAGVLFGSARDTTSGSYVGRVHRFLAEVWPANKLQAGTAVAQRPHQGGRQPNKQPAPARHSNPASPRIAQAESPRPESRPAAPRRRQAASPTAAPRAGNPGISTSAPNLDPPADDWTQLVGNSPLEKGKTVLALIGILAVFLQVSRFLSGQPRS